MEVTQMKRTYNTKISKKANESLERREAVVRSQRCLLAIIVIIIVSLGILLGTGINALASNDKPTGNYKYYKSICIEEGDTLWDIAEEYIVGTDMSHDEYIREICELNNICKDDIHAGEYIIVSYYSTNLQ